MGRDNSMKIVGGMLFGAAAMYFLDPRSGRRRRAQARDQAVRVFHVAENALERFMEDAGNRAQGTVARTRRFLTPEEIVDDQRVEARVRSVLGRLTSNVSGVTVEARSGNVVLSGTVLEEELGHVLTGIRRVRGVRRVESRLNSVPRINKKDRSRKVPVPKQRLGTPPDVLQHNMSPTSRVIVGTTGATLAIAGLRGGGAKGLAAAALGGLMMARALTRSQTAHEVARQPRRPATVQKSLEIQAPVRGVFAFWSSFRNFPRFMQHVREVREMEGGISHWVADGPAGIPASWDAEVVTLQPHRRISWRSLDGSSVMTAGEVRFEEVDANTTRLHVRMTYSPPGGAIGDAVATLFGANPKRQLDEDLLRFKTLLEAGRVRANGHTVTREDVGLVPQPE